MAEPAAPAAAEVWSFPTNIAEFDDDERISFSKLDGKYVAVQADGTEFEFDQGLKRWIPLADEEEEAALAAAQEQAQLFAYGDNDDAAEPAFGAKGPRKRKQDQTSSYSNEYGRREQNGNGNGNNNNNSSNDDGNSRSKKRVKAQPAPKQPKKNTAVYVTGLPADATIEEVAELFSRKCGVIAEEIDSGRPRIKLYTDAEGRFKGDALVVFFKPQSVDMAIMLLDDTPFRFGAPSGSAGTDAAASGHMRVQVADASYKKTTYANEDAAAEGVAQGATAASSAARESGTGAPERTHASNAPSGGGRGKGSGGGGSANNQDKQKIIKKTQKLDAKLADWSDDEGPYYGGGGGGGKGNSRNPKWDKVVVLRHMFTLAELDADPAALLDIKEDIREECAKLGEVTNVVLFDREAAGVVSVKFKTPTAAAACVRLMDGRAFDGRVVEARLATGREKFKKSGKDGGGDSDKSEDDDDDDDGGF
ncbi:nuclear mRNA splicing factor-associated protein [Niveomyces insectorum RCEF 264]|uniref:Nuclear mRNA splicing factor-associated protein n=1 Tax=Niveomyces insectorum RCEF 264 TaxID=1081102 RepID=A0A167YUU8_9HYPO|nr:nuclear mRNA splicing factor-associated protein [Niveomyces insectorum RCEF 264]